MNTDIAKIISVLQNALHPVVVVKNVIPEEFGLVVSSLALMQKDTGKKISIIIEGQPEGWLKYIFGNFGIEYNDALQALKHVIEIPCGDGSISSVSYDVQDGKFFLYITPGNAKFDFNAVQFKTFGSQHDVMVTVGVNNLAELDKVIGDGKSSVMSAHHVVFGVPSADSFKTANNTVYYGGSDLVTVMKIILGLSRTGRMSENTKNAVAAFLLGANPAKIKEPLFLAEVYRVLSELFKSGVNIGTINTVMTNKKIEYAAIHKKISEKAKVNTQKKTAYVSLSKSDIETAGIKIEDLTLNVKEVAISLTVPHVMIAIEHDAESKLVFVAGESDDVKATASQLHLTLIDHNAAGLVLSKEVKNYAIQNGFISPSGEGDKPKTEKSEKSDKPETSEKPKQNPQNTQSQPQQPSAQNPQQESQPKQQQSTQQPGQFQGQQSSSQNLQNNANQNQQRQNQPQFVAKPRFQQVDQRPQPNERPIEQRTVHAPVKREETPVKEPQTASAVAPAQQVQPSQQPSVPVRNTLGQSVNFGEIAKRIKSAS